MNSPTIQIIANMPSLHPLALSSPYGNWARILKSFLFVLLQIPVSSWAQALVEPDEEQLAWLGQQIFHNECNSNPACLTAWNQGEDFPSLGLGHFIWYRAGQQEIYTESFPALLGYMQSKGVNPPEWIITSQSEQPWATREDFLAAYEDDRLKELRSFLASNMELQTAFIVDRFNLAFEHLLDGIPASEQQALGNRFSAVAEAHTPYGLYALIDYVHFKGEGSNPDERYDGQGWGLLQVLQGMPVNSSTPLEDFVQSARTILAQRVTNAPPERLEQRWLDGWNNRLSTYLPESKNTAVQE